MKKTALAVVALGFSLTVLMAGGSPGTSTEVCPSDTRFAWHATFAGDPEGGGSTKLAAVIQGLELAYAEGRPEVSLDSLDMSDTTTFVVDSTGAVQEAPDEAPGLVSVDLPGSPQVQVIRAKDGTWLAIGGSHCSSEDSSQGGGPKQ
jgi:hypothetical protein